MRKTFIAGLAGLASTFAMPALAQDATTADPAAQPTGYDQAPAGGIPDPTTEETPFTGLYVAGSVGYAVQPNDGRAVLSFDRGLDGGYGDQVSTATGANAFSPGFCGGRANAATPAFGCRNDTDGIEYYGRVGFDIQRGKIVAGVVGEFGRPRISDNTSGFSTTPANYIFLRTVDWEASARLRAGFVAGRSTLFYASGGGGYAKIDSKFFTSNGANAFGSRGKEKHFGYVFGGGVEQMIGNNLSIGLEYLFHQYKDDDFRVRVTQGTAPATNPFVLAPGTTGTDIRRTDEKFRWNSLRGNVTFRF